MEEIVGGAGAINYFSNVGQHNWAVTIDNVKYDG